MEKIEKENYILNIFPTDTESPRNWDNFGTMICFHKTYELGDEQNIINLNDFDNWDEQRKWLQKNIDPAVLLPLYLYDHSGITISTSPFSCRWDSGQIGWILVSKEDVKKEYQVKRITKDIIQKVTAIL